MGRECGEGPDRCTEVKFQQKQPLTRSRHIFQRNFLFLVFLLTFGVAGMRSRRSRMPPAWLWWQQRCAQLLRKPVPIRMGYCQLKVKKIWQRHPGTQGLPWAKENFRCGWIIPLNIQDSWRQGFALAQTLLLPAHFGAPMYAATARSDPSGPWGTGTN